MQRVRFGSPVWCEPENGANGVPNPLQGSPVGAVTCGAATDARSGGALARLSNGDMRNTRLAQA